MPLTTQQRYKRLLRFERNILRAFNTATPAMLVDGKNWYASAQASLLAIGEQYGVTNVYTLAAICAVLSPRQQWSSNLKSVRAVLRAKDSIVPPICAGFNTNIDKAWRIAKGELGTESVSGPKVSSFYWNLCGDLQRVTIDVWACFAAGVTDPKELGHLDRQYRYEDLTKAYQRVANGLGFEPAELQAIVWIAVRGKGE